MNTKDHIVSFLAGSRNPSDLAERLLTVAAAELAVRMQSEIDAVGSDCHPDHPKEAKALAADVLHAVETWDDLPVCVEGWEYWFGCAGVFRAYSIALDLHSSI